MKPVGYKPTATGFRAWVRVTSKPDDFNELSTKRFPATATPAVIEQWRTEEEARLQIKLDARRNKRASVVGGASHGFRFDAIERYLPAVQAMPSLEDRVRDIMRWIDEFRDRDRATITALEIRTVRDRWLTVGPKRVQVKTNGVWQYIDKPVGLGASTVNHRLRALSHFFTLLDPEKRNPVHDVEEADEPQALPRAIAYETIRQILAAMPDRGAPPAREKGEKRPRPTVSLVKLRVRVLAYTGIEPAELARLTEDGVADAIRTKLLLVPGRRKGKGSSGRGVPLTQDGVEALAELRRHKGVGKFHRRNVLRGWHLACVKVLGRTLRLKDLRHSFVTYVVRGNKDLKTAQLLAGHKSATTTERYALAAMLPLLRAGIEAFDQETRKDE